MSRLRAGLAAALAIAVVAGLAIADDDASPIAPFSRATPGGALPDGWRELVFRNIPGHTRYALVRDDQAGVVLRAEANASASGIVHPLDAPADERPLLRWRWKADGLIEHGDVTRRGGDDYPARVYVTFRYPPARRTLADRARSALGRAIFGVEPPDAALSYVWDRRAAVGTLVPNAYTTRVRMIVVESGTARVGRWLDYERDIVADYRRAFGEEPPPLAGIAVMTDADDTGESVSASYGDIVLAPRPAAR